jgi:predicted transcriptional regulator
VSYSDANTQWPRERTRIYYDILRSILREERTSGTVRITRVQNRVNIPSDRFRRHLTQMERLGLLVFQDSLSITAQGRDFVSEYRRFTQVLRRFGLA